MSLLLISGPAAAGPGGAVGLVVLGLTRLVSAQDLFVGFSRAAAITILSLYIITTGLERTGATRILETATSAI